jgi:hypothetical protein
MAQFEDLQQLWRRQPQRTMPLREATALSHAFRRYGRLHDLINLGKVVMIACQLVFLVAQLRHRPLALFGACLADFSAILFMVSDWRTQRAIARLNFAAPSVAFLRSAIARLHVQRNPFRTRAFYIAMGGVWIGLNLMLASMESRMTLASALLALAFTTAMPFAVYGLGRWVRGKRFERECRPLIHRLEGALRTMLETTLDTTLDTTEADRV